METFLEFLLTIWDQFSCLPVSADLCITEISHVDSDTIAKILSNWKTLASRNFVIS